MAYKQTPGRGSLQKFANVSQFCPGGGGGDECKAFDKKTKKVKDTREREKRRIGTQVGDIVMVNPLASLKRKSKKLMFFNQIKTSQVKQFQQKKNKLVTLKR